MSKKAKDLEWKNRVLCSDESCIGVIGPDGRCKECGLAYEGQLPESFNAVLPEASPAQPSNEDAADEQAHDEPADNNAAQPVDGDDEWERRTLCIDESCIGVIGTDGRCKECGKPYPT